MLEENERGILMKTPLMHSPIQINQVKLSSRLVMPPMATEKSAGDGQVTEALVAYYDEKTKGGHVGLLITEHSYIDSKYPWLMRMLLLFIRKLLMPFTLMAARLWLRLIMQEVLLK